MLRIKIYSDLHTSLKLFVTNWKRFAYVPVKVSCAQIRGGSYTNLRHILYDDEIFIYKFETFCIKI